MMRVGQPFVLQAGEGFTTSSTAPSAPSRRSRAGRQRIQLLQHRRHPWRWQSAAGRSQQCHEPVLLQSRRQLVESRQPERRLHGVRRPGKPSRRRASRSSTARQDAHLRRGPSEIPMSPFTDLPLVNYTGNGSQFPDDAVASNSFIVVNSISILKQPEKLTYLDRVELRTRRSPPSRSNPAKRQRTADDPPQFGPDRHRRHHDQGHRPGRRLRRRRRSTADAA